MEAIALCWGDAGGDGVRRVTESTTIGYLGPPGTFTEEALQARRTWREQSVSRSPAFGTCSGRWATA